MNYKLSFPTALLVAGVMLCGGCHGSGGAGAASSDDAGGSQPATNSGGTSSGTGVSAATAIDDSKISIVPLKGIAKPVKVIVATDLHFGKPTDPPALLFRYRTDLPMPPVTPAAKAALHAEALSLWGVVQKVTEQSHLQSAVITACDAPPKGSTHAAHVVSFAWELHNGVWHEIA